MDLPANRLITTIRGTATICKADRQKLAFLRIQEKPSGRWDRGKSGSAARDFYSALYSGKTPPFGLSDVQGKSRTKITSTSWEDRSLSQILLTQGFSAELLSTTPLFTVIPTPPKIL